MLEYLIFILLFAAFTNAAHVVYINDGFDVDSAGSYKFLSNGFTKSERDMNEF